MTTTVNITRGETIVRALRAFEAEDVRDAMAKALYGRAFTWIVQRVNTILAPKDAHTPQKKLGILDIFGFEVFDSNGFEQLLINLANEQLQFFFNNHIFAMELDEYAREGIDASNITYVHKTAAVLGIILSLRPSHPNLILTTSLIPLSPPRPLPSPPLSCSMILMHCTCLLNPNQPNALEMALEQVRRQSTGAGHAAQQASGYPLHVR